MIQDFKQKGFTIRLAQGFTLIEILVVVVISAMLVAGGIASYNNFNERQQVVAVGKQLYTDLRLAQSMASAGDKPEECTGSLESVQLEFVSDESYQIAALCGGIEVAVGAARVLGNGMALEVGNDTMVKFRVLGRGAEDKTFVIEGLGRQYRVEVSPTGEVVDKGLVSGT